MMIESMLHELVGPGAVLLVAANGTKKPVHEAWQTVTLEQTQSTQYQAELSRTIRRGGNLGVLLGPASGDLVTVDFDVDAALENFLQLNPPLDKTFRSRGARAGQIWLRMRGAYPQQIHKLKNSKGETLGEWRGGGGAQSIIWGKHPSGCHYHFVVSEPVIEISFTDIQWPPDWQLPWNNAPGQDPATMPIVEVQDKNRFRRDVREQKIPIRWPDSLDSIFAKQLGMSLAPYAFFERAGRCVELQFDYKLGISHLVEADSYGFRTDLETICAPYQEVKDPETKQKRKIFKTIPLNLSHTVLASKDFLQELRPLLGFSTVRLPIRRSNGAIELLPEGYDDESGILTVSGPGADYTKPAKNLSLKEAAECLRGLLSEFCFYEQDKERAISVAISGMLTLYCRLLLGPRIQRPAFLYSANAEGAGKTLLAKLAIIPALGFCPTGTVPKDEDEFRKRFFACALVDAAVLFLDNVKGHLSSPSLEAFLTSSIIQDRMLGGSRLMSFEHNAITFITGNQASYSPDLRRRTLTIELFLAEMRSEDRMIEHPLDDETIFAKRAEILAMLCKLVSAWVKAGQPKASVSHASFPQWSEMIGGVLEYAGFASPCTQAHTEFSGDIDTQDMEKLVDLMNPGKVFSYDQLVEYCRAYELFERLIPANGQQDTSQRSKFGKLMRRYHGRILSRKLQFLIGGPTRKTRTFTIRDLETNQKK